MPWGPYYQSLPGRSIYTTGTIFSIAVLNGGSGYPASSTTIPLTITLTSGSGVSAQATTNASGVIVSVQMVSNGTGVNSAPASIVAGGGGSGATFAANFVAIIDQPTWNSLIDNFVNWKANVNGGGFQLSNLTIGLGAGNSLNFVSGECVVDGNLAFVSAGITLAPGTNNDVALPGNGLCILNPIAGAATISGFVAPGALGTMVSFYNNTGYPVTLINTGSAAGNKFYTPRQSLVVPNQTCFTLIYVSDLFWHLHSIDAESQPGFTALTLANSWVNNTSGLATAAFMVDSLGRVTVRGLIKNGTTTSGTIIATLPAGATPPLPVQFVVANGTSAPAVLRVDASGNISIQSSGVTNSFLNLEGISFWTF